MSSQEDTGFLPKLKKKKLDVGTSEVETSKTSNAPSTEQQHIPNSLTGHATICFVTKEVHLKDDSTHKGADEHHHTRKHFFQGYLYNKTKKSYGLMGEGMCATPL